MNALEKAGLDISEFAGGLHFIINENGKKRRSLLKGFAAFFKCIKEISK